MEIIFEILLQFFGELFLQLLFELIAEFGMQGLSEPFRRSRPVHPILAVVVYLALGAIAGWLSLQIFPHLLISSPTVRLANLVLTPLLAGLCMSLVGAWRRKRGDDIVRLDRFIYGFLFAVAMAFVRFHFGGAG